ncbi:MAG: flippase-like domain-containing protein [Syntrophobacterales bacterium]|nr:MAG: flippase-like domain-containing protein [Syntrophobacterales bacterium]
MKRWIKIGILIFIAVAVLVSVSDIRKMIRLSAKLDLYFLGLSFAAAFGSYLLIALSLKKILELMDIRLSFVEIFNISWVSTSINYVLSTGGIGGFTARVYLLKKKGISYSETIVISIIHTFIINVILMLFVLIGFSSLLASRQMGIYNFLISSFLIFIALYVTYLAFKSVVNREFRENWIDRIARWTNKLHSSFSKKGGTIIEGGELTSFKAEFNQGMELMGLKRGELKAPVLYVFLDWIGCLLTLYFCFLAIHYFIHPEVLIVGFAVGLFASILSLIPGGLGVMEGSMAAIYYSLNVPLEEAIVAVILYRLIFYVFPFLTSLLVYRSLFKEARIPVEPSDRGERVKREAQK